jgi:hypothetical protein
MTKHIEKTWTRIKPYGSEDEHTYWISGIYKITSYRPGEYLAFFIQDHFNNWGDHPSKPPHDGEYGKCWKTLKAAQADCVTHAKNHKPALRTIQRAAELKASIIIEAQDYLEAA